ncbi:Inosine/uridine-preferring nucleoside hydrolase domain-containing protein [Bisporella sp. PMI_857]|nr:Inosine/uridine-preferring nucleoside hydrolase domain-containing protein [Bisporella sp. PMI_857]
MAPEKVIIDTDPGVDDILAIALALNHPEKLDVLLFSVTHGNVGAVSCLKNLVALLGVLDAEKLFQKSNRSTGKPLVALGADKPISKEHAHGTPDNSRSWEGFHGIDGLNGVHSKLPDLVSADFRESFNAESELAKAYSYFQPSCLPAHREILNQLRSHEPKTITIVAIGPCTNLALAVAEDAVTFARVKKIIIMGGAVRGPGNQTPRSEFNIYADPDAAADIFNLTLRSLAPEQRVEVVLVPLDVTCKHELTQETWETFSKPLVQSGSPLAVFIDGILDRTFEKMRSLFNNGTFGCHDALTIHCLLEPSLVKYEDGLDIRVERHGEWTRGETVLDQRPSVIWNDTLDAVIRDNGGWVSGLERNSITVLASSGVDGPAYGLRLLEGIFL